MFKKTKLAGVFVVALCVMGAFASSAFAVEARVAAGGRVNATSASTTFEGSGVSIICPLTLGTTLNTGPINVAAGNTIGSVNSVTIGACSGGSVSAVLGVPWAITINRALTAEGGALTTTNATGLLVNIVNAAFNLSVFGGFVNCLYRGTAGALLTLTQTARGATTYTARTLTALGGVTLPLASGGFGCPANGSFAGTFTLAATQTITLS